MAKRQNWASNISQHSGADGENMTKKKYHWISILILIMTDTNRTINEKQTTDNRAPKLKDWTKGQTKTRSQIWYFMWLVRQPIYSPSINREVELEWERKSTSRSQKDLQDKTRQVKSSHRCYCSWWWRYSQHQHQHRHLPPHRWDTLLSVLYTLSNVNRN